MKLQPAGHTMAQQPARKPGVCFWGLGSVGATASQAQGAGVPSGGAPDAGAARSARLLLTSYLKNLRW